MTGSPEYLFRFLKQHDQDTKVKLFLEQYNDYGFIGKLGDIPFHFLYNWEFVSASVEDGYLILKLTWYQENEVKAD